VLTVSFHAARDQSGNAFFPRTGHLNDVGGKSGRNYSVNVPLNAGMDDACYESIFRPVLTRVFETFQPTAVVLCCGADSLSGDRVGCWNLSIKGHAAVLDFVKTYNLPMMVLGGGGYTIRNVARCWTYETSRMLGVPISEDVPWHDYMDYYAPEYKLFVPTSNMENENTREKVDKIKEQIFEQLRGVEHAPNVQMRRAPDAVNAANSEDEDEDEVWAADARPIRRRRQHLAEFFDTDDAESDRLETERMSNFDEPPTLLGENGA